MTPLAPACQVQAVSCKYGMFGMLFAALSNMAWVALSAVVAFPWGRGVGKADQTVLSMACFVVLPSLLPLIATLAFASLPSRAAPLCGDCGGLC